MAMVINSNIMSLNAQNQLTKTNNDLNTAMERLTSGKRINSAADDAAGLAISNRMTSQVRGLDQAVRNANDGISLIQTAEGALDESTNILQRMRELSIQSANGTYSEGNRSTLNAEVQQLVKELDRISETTAFNGQKILDGSLGDVALQVGSEANETISFNIQAMDSQTLGLGSTSTDLSGDRIDSSETYDIDEGSVLINGQSLASITNLGGGAATDTTLQDVLDDINENVEGVSASGFNVVEAETAGTGALSATETLRITLGSTDGGAAVNYDISNTANMDELVDKINTATGGNVVASVDDSGKLSLSNTTGGTITVSYDSSAPFAAAEAGASLETITGIDDVGSSGLQGFRGSIALTSDDGSAITVTKGANGSDADLAALGLREMAGAGQVTSSALDGTAQNAALAAGDVMINGVDIGAIDANDGLAAKVDAINAVSDETGVTATVKAEQSFAADVTRSFATDTATDTGDAAAIAAYTDDGTDVLSINGIDVTTEVIAGSAADGVAGIAEALNDLTATTGVSASVNSDGFIELISDGPINLGIVGAGDWADVGAGLGTTAATTNGGLGADDGSLVLNGYEIQDLDLDSVENAISDINAATANTGVTASLDENGQLQLSSSSTITVQAGAENGQATAKVLGITFDQNLINSTDGDAAGEGMDSLVINPSIGLDSANDTPISIEVTAAGAAATGLKNLNTDLSSTVTGSAIANIDISTVAGAQSAIGSIDNALDAINSTRGDLGAVNNRLDFTINNLSSISENVSAARSRVEDADFAKESAALSRSQVLQQAGTAMLAQANAAPQQVLSLLQ
ncbi:MAG: flagellin [Oceanospirillaceae bacterium]|nr:flagellin [Oceanospirillaceae bacterium]